MLQTFMFYFFYYVDLIPLSFIYFFFKIYLSTKNSIFMAIPTIPSHKAWCGWSVLQGAHNMLVC